MFPRGFRDAEEVKEVLGISEDFVPGTKIFEPPPQNSAVVFISRCRPLDGVTPYLETGIFSWAVS